MKISKKKIEKTKKQKKQKKNMNKKNVMKWKESYSIYDEIFFHYVWMWVKTRINLAHLSIPRSYQKRGNHICEANVKP